VGFAEQVGEVRMTPIIDIASTITAKLHLYYRDQPLGPATGFFKKLNDRVFLITNWHVVTGRHQETKQVLHSKGAIPDRLKFRVPVRGRTGAWVSLESCLYQDAKSSESPEKPRWYEDPVHRHRLDVVAIPIQAPDNGEVRTIDDVNSMPLMPVDIGDEVFVLGYPRGIDGGGEFPIWKRASIATEPEITRDGPQYILVDTATREGMSGAPVIKLFSPPIRMQGIRQYRFIGVYSGRLGDGEMEAQLGKVWDASLIEAIVKSGVVGTSSHLL
jgi:hypothetical protein